jgi:HK97 family phage major capsid protein
MTTTATPTTPKEWEEYVHTTLESPEKFKAAFESGEFQNTLKAYQGASNKTMEDLKAQLIEQTQASVVEMFKRNGTDVTNRVNLAERAGAAYNKLAPGTATEDIWESPGQMLRDVITDSRKLKDDQIARMKKYEEIQNAYSSTVPSEGGYLVPETTRSQVLSVALEQAIVRPRAQVVPMPTGKMKWPVVDFTTEVGEVFGGIVMAWLDEGQTLTETEATFAALELVAHKLGGLASLPNELVHDAAALEAWVRQAMPKAIAHFEDIGFLKGNGVKKPLGALHADNPALIVAGDESGQSSGITWINVLTMFSRMLPESFDNAVWVITPDAIPEIFTMALPVGTGGSAVMVGEGQGSQAPSMTLLGRPIKWSRKAPATLGTQGDISLVDFSTYVIGDTMAMSLDSSPHSSFRSDKTDFRIIERIDGMPGLLSPLTPENNGPTLSAYVQLETRATD